MTYPIPLKGSPQTYFLFTKIQNYYLGPPEKPDRNMACPDSSAHKHLFIPIIEQSVAVKGILLIAHVIPQPGWTRKLSAMGISGQHEDILIFSKHFER